MKILDLFCGLGGAAMGYHQAGFEVVGVDHKKIKDYPFEFVRSDVFDYIDGLCDLRDFVAIHASPPCQRHSIATARWDPTKHVDLIPLTRRYLTVSRLPYIIENVPRAPLFDPLILCGSMFDLRVRRHRLFELNFPVLQPECDHKKQGTVVGVYGNGGAWTRKQAGGGGTKVVGAEAAEALGIDWSNRGVFDDEFDRPYEPVVQFFP